MGLGMIGIQLVVIVTLERPNLVPHLLHAREDPKSWRRRREATTLPCPENTDPPIPLPEPATTTGEDPHGT